MRPQAHGVTAALDGAPKGDPMRGINNGTLTPAQIAQAQGILTKITADIPLSSDDFISDIVNAARGISTPIGVLPATPDAGRFPPLAFAPPAVDPAIPAAVQALADGAQYGDLAAAYDALDAMDAALAAITDRPAAVPVAPIMLRPTVENADPRLIPDVDAAYLVDATAWRVIAGVIADADAGIPQNLGLYGEAGSGKTTLAVQIAAITRRPLFVFESAGKETPADCWGESRGLDPETGIMRYDPSPLIIGLETPFSVVLANDLALLASHAVQNGFNDALDPSMRRFYVPQLGRTVHVAEGVIIIGTWNVASSRYSSARPLAAQILDRFEAGALFEIPYPTNGALEKIIIARSGIDKPNAKRLALVADWLRNDPQPIPVGTRGLIAAARRMMRGSPLGEALYFTVLGSPNIDDRTRTRAYGILNVESGKQTPDDQPLYVVPQTGTYAQIASFA